MWEDPRIRSTWQRRIADSAAKIVKNMQRYVAVSKMFNGAVPDWVVGIIHCLEGDCNFNRHLHNGDPLGAPTRNGPRNRPPGWMQLKPEERTWELSAVDALRYDSMDKKNWTTPETALSALELFNGPGYMKQGIKINSPYLCSGTEWYITGKYVEDPDSHFIRGIVSDQVGCIPLMKALGVKFGGEK